MKISSSTYIREEILPNILELLDKQFKGSINESIDPALSKLLDTADKRVFEKFGIDPLEKKYFIAGSARLHLDTKLKDVFGINEPLGDLDIIIPDRNLWVNAGLEEEYDTNGIYNVPGTVIEVFAEWKPQVADPKKFKDQNVRSTQEILKSANLNQGYYYMALKDIVDYKTILSREKEKQIVTAIKAFLDGSGGDKVNILRKIIGILGINNAKSFFS